MPGRIEALRRAYHRQIANDVLRQNASGVPNNADSSSSSSVRIAKGIVRNIGLPLGSDRLAGQTAGRRFEERRRPSFATPSGCSLIFDRGSGNSRWAETSATTSNTCICPTCDEWSNSTRNFGSSSAITLSRLTS